MKTIGYAIVGTGYFGAELGRILNEQEGARVVAVLDPDNAPAIAQELHCDLETDLEGLCARPDVDAVIVATPNYLHKEPVLCAARHKKNIFCEKPIALSYADCDEMVRAAEENGVVFMAGHVMNFFRAVRRTKQFIAEGKIGKVLYCHSARNGWEEEQPSVSWKKIRAKSGGHLYHHIHELDCIQFLMGPATEVTMVGGNVAHQGEHFGDEDDMLFLQLEFGNNTYAVVEYGSAFHHFPEIGTETVSLFIQQSGHVLHSGFDTELLRQGDENLAHGAGVIEGLDQRMADAPADFSGTVGRVAVVKAFQPHGGRENKIASRAALAEEARHGDFEAASGEHFFHA